MNLNLNWRHGLVNVNFFKVVKLSKNKKPAQKCYMLLLSTIQFTITLPPTYARFLGIDTLATTLVPQNKFQNHHKSETFFFFFLHECPPAWLLFNGFSVVCDTLWRWPHCVFCLPPLLYGVMPLKTIISPRRSFHKLTELSVAQ